MRRIVFFLIRVIEQFKMMKREWQTKKRGGGG